MSAYVKNFDSWNIRKKHINARDEQLLYVRAREVWWTSVGVNVGTEIDGKNEHFERPVVVIQKFGTDQFFGVPVTSSQRGSVFYIPIRYRDRYDVACISQCRVFSNKRLLRKVGRIRKRDYHTITQRLIALVGGERIY